MKKYLPFLSILFITGTCFANPIALPDHKSQLAVWCLLAEAIFIAAAMRFLGYSFFRIMPFWMGITWLTYRCLVFFIDRTRAGPFSENLIYVGTVFLYLQFMVLLVETSLLLILARLFFFNRGGAVELPLTSAMPICFAANMISFVTSLVPYFLVL